MRDDSGSMNTMDRHMTEEREPFADANLRIKVSVLNTIEQLNRLRDRYDEHKLDDVAWDLLLELLRAEQNDQRLSVSGLTVSVQGVSATTSLRRIGELSARGYVARTPDSQDRRRDFVELTATARELLADYLARVDDCLTEPPCTR